MDANELSIRFSYHAPKGDQAEKYPAVRRAAETLAVLLNEFCPESREKALAFTALEEAVMWANASIARRS